MKINVICPTRKRKKDVARLIKSLIDTVYNIESVELIFVVDDDDIETIDFLDFMINNKKIFVTIKKVVVERNKFIFSDLANQALPYCSGELFLAIGDDGVFRTPNWDTKIINEFSLVEDKILLLHFNDLSGHSYKLAGHLVIHKNWIDCVGYFSPPWFNGDWGDWWLTNISNDIGRKKYRHDIIIEHLNIQFNKAKPDETYYEHKKRRESLGSPDSNPDHPFNTKKQIKDENIKSLKNFIKNYRNKNE